MPRGRPKNSDNNALNPKPAKVGKSNASAGNLGFEAQLFLAADKLRKNLEPSDYKHVALGLIFLKYISNAFEAKRAALLSEDAAAAEDPDEYLAENVFWVPKEARWSHLQANAKQPTIGKLIDGAMAEIEKANPGLKGVLPKDYNRPALDKVMLGELTDLASGIAMGEPGDKAKDILGRVYEYFLGGFAGSEGKRGGEFYTPRSVVRVLVEMLEPYKGRVYDPCCGSGGMFVQSEKFVESHGGRIGDIAIYGQESKLHDVAARQDEPRGTRHRRRHPLEQRGKLPQGRVEGPALRLRPSQSAVQCFRLGWGSVTSTVLIATLHLPGFIAPHVSGS
jgi:type I restriction enzyme M protein